MFSRLTCRVRRRRWISPNTAHSVIARKADLFSTARRRADRKFKWDLRQSLARKLIVIIGAARPARLISWTIYDGPAARDRSPRSPDESRIEDWSGAAKRDFQVCRWKWRTLRFALRRKLGNDITISNLDIFYAISTRLSDSAMITWNFTRTVKLDRNEMKNDFKFLSIERGIKFLLSSRLYMFCINCA